MKKQHTLWVEKYRPSSLDDYIIGQDIKTTVQEWINKQDIPNLLLAGKPGSGKTTLAKLLTSNIDCDARYINATDERSMDAIREKVGAFAQAASFKPLKIIVLDEATHLLEASQVLLLNMIETYSLKTRFILTGNFPERIIEPLRSRLQEFDLAPPAKKEIAKHLVEILDTEQIEYEIKDIASIITQFYPDQRAILNNCQKFVIQNKLILNTNSLKSSDYQSLILDELKVSSNKSFNNIRQILADSSIKDFTTIYRFLYENLNDYSKGYDAEIIILIEEYQYHANFKLDQEINTMALIGRILQLTTKKQIL